LLEEEKMRFCVHKIQSQEDGFTEYYGKTRDWVFDCSDAQDFCKFDCAHDLVKLLRADGISTEVIPFPQDSEDYTSKLCFAVGFCCGGVSVLSVIALYQHFWCS
jgi:hypothetical protein